MQIPTPPRICEHRDCEREVTGEIENWSVGGPRRRTHGRLIFHAWVCTDHGSEWAAQMEALDRTVAEITGRST